jgi:hypothetical protein
MPAIRFFAKLFNYTFNSLFKLFPGSEEYWEKRYKAGGNSGSGSFHKLAQFKAEVLNNFVKDKEIKTVIEFGCGDGNQLKLFEFPSYLGFDVSKEAISLCSKIFSHDDTKMFKLMKEYANETAQLTLSLDVIYHLVEDSVFIKYMERLFDSSTNYIIIYSSNTDLQGKFQAAHVKHRKFSTWIEQNKPEWKLIQFIPNKFPYSKDKHRGSFADFHIYERSKRD